MDTARYRVDGGQAVHLARWPTDEAAHYDSRKDYKHRLRAHRDELRRLQQLLYAADRYAVLVIFQGMDAAGKDSAIKAIMSGVNPQGCQVHSFDHPTAEELDHDFLWRTVQRLPERGRIGIFNRSYYEEVLIVRVHPEMLRAQKVPDARINDAALWDQRYRSIVDHERHLRLNGTRVVKIFLHLSREAQRHRFLRRIDDPRRNWKFSRADVGERRFWDDYQAAYAACLGATSKAEAPWYVVPADDKKNARLIIAQVLIDTLAGLDMRYPRPDPQHVADMREARAQLLAE